MRNPSPLPWPSGPAITQVTSGASVEVLAIDDDAELLHMLGELLAREGMHLHSATDGVTGLRLLEHQRPDVLVLDLMLPDANGLDLCRRLRANGHGVPVLMLTARGDPIDRVLGLELGADDYLCKPFEPRELVARIRALARRHAGADAQTRLAFGALVIDLLQRRVTVNGAAVALTSHEFKLLAALAVQPGLPVSREALSAAVQPGGYMPLDRAVDVQVARLRKKLRSVDPQVEFIETVRGEGYVFVPRAGRELSKA